MKSNHKGVAHEAMAYGLGLLATLAAALTVLIIGINLRARQSVIACD